MVFSSPLFVFVFLPVTLILNYLMGRKLRNLVLLVLSLLFYAWGEPKNVLIMIITIAINYILGILIEKNDQGKWSRRLLLLAAIFVDLGLLVYFKYFNFFIEIFNGVFYSNISIKKIALPIGISFYTFQILSYIIDVYRRQAKAQKNILDLALYISLFPQLIAGPIVRYVDIEQQIHERSVTIDSFSSGAYLFMIGFAKKILLADRLAPLADVAFDNIGSSFLLSWGGIAAYTLQIYFDFDGYSNMAIGLGRMFGFEFQSNFNFPYISKSIKEFWRRWHISLSSWFRDYVYIPLGGSRCGKYRQCFNLIVVFFLTGLWHGASFNFIVWGLYYAFFLLIERMGLGKRLSRWHPAIGHCYTILVIALGWVFFRADTLKDAILYIGSMFTIHGNDFMELVVNTRNSDAFFLLAGCFFAYPHTNIGKRIASLRFHEAIRKISATLIFIIALCYMVGSGFSPFLYFRF